MFRQKISKLRRNLFEHFASDRYSRPSLYDIDRKLEKYLDYDNQFFLEVGAYDGFRYSNTYYFEKFRGWTGILVEGIPELYQKCVKERPNSRVFNCALVSQDFKEPYVTMKYSGAMSIVEGARKSYQSDIEHIKKGCEIQHIISYDILVPARTITSILDECKVKNIDFFSLDVEGFELNVLKGLDFSKYRPNYMLIETNFKDEIDKYICELFIQVDQFSPRDFLYKIKS